MVAGSNPVAPTILIDLILVFFRLIKCNNQYRRVYHKMESWPLVSVSEGLA
ncbi:MAG: hypothetical protein WCE22_06575 [Candidatus Aquirickettsiella gammari]